MRVDLGQALHWITGSGSADFGAVVAFAAHGFILRTRRKDEAKVLDTLRMGGSGTGWGLTDEQVAGQKGWEPKKARSALRRLRRKGQVRESEGRWYLGSAGASRETLSS
jgi:hypothetical protein